MKTMVVFRKFKDGEVIAVFPQISYNYVYLMSYLHTGQHGGCVRHISNFTTPATEEEYKPLLKELQDIGYTDLQVLKRIMWYPPQSFCTYSNEDLPAAISAA